jgi:hypothetical protein
VISKLLPGLAVLIPILALAQSGENSDGQTASLSALSVEELCSARENADSLAELERREIFSARELRAIQDGEVREGMSLETLICARGPPDIIVDGVVRRSFGTADVYVSDDTAGFDLYVFLGSPESTALYVVDHEDPAAIVRNPDYALSCDQNSGGLTNCRLYGDSDAFSARTSSCGPGQLSGATATPEELLTRGRCR